MLTTPLTDFRKHFVIPLCLGAALITGCATTAPTDSAPSSVSTTPMTHQRPAPRIDWPQLQDGLAKALGGVTGTEITAPNANSLHVRIPVADGFRSDSADVRPTLARALDSIVPTLNSFPDLALHIVGHTDSAGSEMYNLQLSIKRSEAVMEYLRSRGIPLARMTADGKGEAEPIADNARDAGRARNRRVEILLKPLE